MNGIRRAVAFLTPVGGAVAPAPDALAWFPAVGLAIGLALGGWWWLADRAWPASVVAVLVVGADLAVTGLLHLDGLIDAADGLLPHLDRSRRLAVMASPEIGAFGVAVAGVVLIARWAGILSLRPAPLLLAGLWCESRTAMAVVVRTQPYARVEGGLATAFLGGRVDAVPLVAGGVVSLVLAGAWKFPAGVVAVTAGAIGAIGVVALARRRLGGFTGDILGAAGVIAETAGLLVAAAKW
jgi:adenosylcobinamide-GDP ribazoletransferase